MPETSATYDRIKDLMDECTRAMSRNLAERLYRPSPLADFLARNMPAPKPRSRAQIELEKAKNRLADKLIALASWLKGYDITGEDW